MKNRGIFGVIGLLLVGTVFGAVLFSGLGWVRPALGEVKIGSETAPVVSVPADIISLNNTFIQVAEKVTPSIVQISVVSRAKERSNEAFKFFFPFRDDIPRDQQSSGSGVIINKSGYILTNNHVVENATQVEVALNDKRKFPATVVGTDPLTDLAVIKIDATDLTDAYLGDSDSLRVGEWVMAIGNPLSLSSTVTAGIVSAKGRNLQLIEDRAGVEYFIQTDAAINPGNSGGALVNLYGKVIGINTAIATNGISGSYIGYGFAIPINIAKVVAEDLISSGKIRRGYIGVSISEVDASTAKAVGLDKPTGVMVQSIVPDGAAAKEDIKEGDIILKIEEKEVTQPSELQSYVARKRAGDSVKLTLYRDGKKLERYVTLKAPDSTEKDTNRPINKKDSGEKKESVKELAFDDIGITVTNLTAEEADKFNVPAGIMVKSVKNFSSAYNQRIISGTVITEVDRKKINSVNDFEEAIERKRGEAILMKMVDSDGNTRFVGLDIPAK
ncbi:MAG: Do family serine endopeptidase [Ignavibacteriales bacterium]|nr:Do family serine endopeptidase [Ignavibacteriales bacterium]MCF8435236.1 Do family serine endopeptidase [Ignavibacteriales bacterium]